MKKITHLIILLFLCTFKLYSQESIQVYNYFCSTFHDDKLYAQVTQRLNQNFFNQAPKKKKGFINKAFSPKTPDIKIKPIFLTEKNFNLRRIREEVKLRSKEENAVVIFHIFDHGQNKEGNTLPSVKCYPNAFSDTPSAFLDVQKEILLKLADSDARFTLVFVDACNEPLQISIPDYQSKNNSITTDQQSQWVTYERMVKKLSGNRQKDYKKVTIDKKFKSQPLGILLSGKGYVGISSSSIGEKAVASKDIGGVASFWYYDLLTNMHELRGKNSNWMAFLERWREVVHKSVRYLDDRVQTPTFIGQINGVGLYSQGVFEPVLDTTYKGIPVKDATYRERAVSFFQLLNKESKIRDFNKLGIDPNSFLLYNDAPIAEKEEAGYTNLQTFLSPKEIESRKGVKVEFLLDTLIYAGRYFQRGKNKVRKSWDGYFVKEVIKKPNNEAIDTLTRVLLIDRNTQNRKLRRKGISFAPDRLIPPTDTVGEDTIEVKTPEPWKPVALDSIVDSLFVEKGFALINGYHELLKKAALNFNNPAYLPTIIQLSNNSFENPDSNIIEYNTRHKIEPDSGTVKQYMDHIWEDYPLIYDEAKFFLCSALPLLRTHPEDSTQKILLTKLDSTTWTGEFEFIQGFAGTKGSKLAYEDRTHKVITLKMEERCGYPESSSFPCFRIAITGVKVIDTYKESDCDLFEEELDGDR